MEIQGHYENGVVVPHDGLSLPDGTAVTIVVRPTTQPRKVVLMTPEERQRFLEALARIDAVPNENPGDTFSGVDHDQVLYGKRA
jgi:predicted DNA-binding antitoxin AbrB/MazE fold protein